MSNELEKFLKDSALVQEFDNFLKDNGVDSTNRRQIIIDVTNGGYSIDTIIDRTISWSDSDKSYYFWYFLQLKWLLTLIRKPNVTSLKKYLFQKYKSYIRYTTHGYQEYHAIGGDGVLDYGEREFHIAYSKYQRIEKRYEEYFKRKT